MLERQRTDGADKNSRAIDPLFIEPQNEDFQFQLNSSDLSLEIVPIDVSKIDLSNTVSE